MQLIVASVTVQCAPTTPAAERVPIQLWFKFFVVHDYYKVLAEQRCCCSTRIFSMFLYKKIVPVELMKICFSDWFSFCLLKPKCVAVLD